MQLPSMTSLATKEAWDPWTTHSSHSCVDCMWRAGYMYTVNICVDIDASSGTGSLSTKSLRWLTILRKFDFPQIESSYMPNTELSSTRLFAMSISLPFLNTILWKFYSLNYWYSTCNVKIVYHFNWSTCSFFLEGHPFVIKAEI